MSTSCSFGHFSGRNKLGNYGGASEASMMRRAACRILAFTLVLSLHIASGQAQSVSLKWGRADSAGLSAWQVVAGEMPELAADAKKFRFNPSRDLRQLNFDLDGDGHDEIFLSGTIDSFCGSAGCMTFVLKRGEGRKWSIVCQTYAHYGSKQGDVRIGPKDESGWRSFAASSQVNWIKQADGDVSCEETPLRRR